MRRKTYAVIPARLSSSRLPGKLLLRETGKPLLQYVWEATCRAQLVDEVIVAAEDAEIATAVESFGGRCELTGEHPSGTDRVAEVIRRCCPDAGLVINVQGDEPELDGATIDALIATMHANPAAEMGTLATPIRSLDVLAQPSCVKVVRAQDGRALYFSRAAVPVSRDCPPEQLLASGAESPWLLHLGIYAYRPEFLLRLTELPPSPLEQLEKLEQLRALEAGAAIQLAVVEHRSVGIDTPEDYARFVARMQRAA